jgi:hypothetical protein
MTDAEPTLDEAYLTPAGAPSPFLPGTQIQYAWDSTSLGLIKACPRLYQYTIIDGWQPPGESIHLRFGIEYHAALEHFDRLIASGADRPSALRGMLQQALLSTSDWNPDRETKAGKYKNRDSLAQLLVDYIDHFDPDPARTYIKSDGSPAVELSFRFELDFGPSWTRAEFIPELGREAELTDSPQPYLLSGHLDRVVEFNSQLFVMDRKTTTTTLGGYYFSQYEPHNQMTLYTLAGKIMLEAPIRGVIIDAAQIKLEDPNAFARGFTYRTEAQLQEWLGDLSSTLSLAEHYATTNYWPMNDTACDRFGGCRFRSICAKDPHVRGAFLKSEFTKLEPEDRWNPLKSR